MSTRQNLGFAPSRESVLSETGHYADRTHSRMNTCAHATMRESTNDQA